MSATRRALPALPALEAAGPARAAWPEKPVRLFVGFPPGGPTDSSPAPWSRLQAAWGQPVVIENRPGASQMIAAEAVAKSPADGYTLMLCTSNLTTNPAVFSRLPYDTMRDFDPIIIVYSSPTVLFTGPDQPYRTVRDVVEAAKRKPGMAAATSGVATSGHFATEMFMRAAGIELTHVPYRGAVPAVQDVMGGRVPITFSTLSGVIALARDGKLRPLAIAAPRRSPAFPDVPTMAGGGLPDPRHLPWYSFSPRPGCRSRSSTASSGMCRACCAAPTSSPASRIPAAWSRTKAPPNSAPASRARLRTNTEVARLANIHID